MRFLEAIDCVWIVVQTDISNTRATAVLTFAIDKSLHIKINSKGAMFRVCNSTRNGNAQFVVTDIFRRHEVNHEVSTHDIEHDSDIGTFGSWFEERGCLIYIAKVGDYIR